MQSLLNWKVGFSSLYFVDSRVKFVMGITFFAYIVKFSGKMETNFSHYNHMHVKQRLWIVFCH